MKSQIESARVHLNQVHNSANKSPLHLAVIDLFTGLANANGVNATLPIVAGEEAAAESTSRVEQAPASDGLKPAPRAKVASKKKR